MTEAALDAFLICARWRIDFGGRFGRVPAAADSSALPRALHRSETIAE